MQKVDTFLLLRQEYLANLMSGAHSGSDLPMMLQNDNAKQAVNLEKLCLVCILYLFCTFYGKNEKKNQSPHLGRD